jgi:hypothetical protein
MMEILGVLHHLVLKDVSIQNVEKHSQQMRRTMLIVGALKLAGFECLFFGFHSIWEKYLKHVKVDDKLEYRMVEMWEN